MEGYRDGSSSGGVVLRDSAVSFWRTNKGDWVPCASLIKNNTSLPAKSAIPNPGGWSGLNGLEFVDIGDSEDITSEIPAK